MADKNRPDRSTSKRDPAEDDAGDNRAEYLGIGFAYMNQAGWDCLDEYAVDFAELGFQAKEHETTKKHFPARIIQAVY